MADIPETWTEAALDTHDYTLHRFTGWTVAQLVLQAGFEVFDELPRPVRRALGECVVTFDPRPVAAWVKTNIPPGTRGSAAGRRMIRAVVRAIAAQEEADLRQFAALYRRRHGWVLPHVAAQATRTRYASAASRRRSRSSNAAPKAALGPAQA